MDLRIKAIRKIEYKTMFEDFISESNSLSHFYDKKKNYSNKLEIDSDGRYIYLIGKYEVESKKMRAYDLWENKILKLANIPEKYIDIDSIMYGSDLFLFADANGNDEYLTDCYCYCTKTNIWTTLPEVKNKRNNKTLSIVNQKLYVLLGSYDEDLIFNYDIEVLDLTTRTTWEQFIITGIEFPVRHTLTYIIDSKYLLLLGGERTDNEDEEKKGYLINITDFTTKVHYRLDSPLISFTSTVFWRNVIAANIVETEKLDKFFNVLMIDN